MDPDGVDAEQDLASEEEAPHMDSADDDNALAAPSPEQKQVDQPHSDPIINPDYDDEEQVPWPEAQAELHADPAPWAEPDAKFEDEMHLLDRALYPQAGFTLRVAITHLLALQRRFKVAAVQMQTTFMVTRGLLPLGIFCALMMKLCG